MDISNEAKRVFDTIKQYGPVRSAEIVKMLDISLKTAYKHLSKLLDEDLINKTGSTPMVFYAVKIPLEKNSFIPDKNDQIINDNYLFVSPSGDMLPGIKGFREWCQKNKFDVKREEKTFLEMLKSSQKLKKEGLISAKKSILSGNKKLYLDNIFFSDFYTIGHFGKTKLGQLVYLGKSSQNKSLIKEIVSIISPSIFILIKKYNIKLICYIPPTIDRRVQFMDVLKKELKIDLPEVKAIKVPNPTKVPQKTLRKLEDRIFNADKTIAISPNHDINSNVLIIDDATGSGATLNETASKIRKIAKGKIKIIGYSVVGSFKGFDVISEV